MGSSPAESYESAGSQEDGSEGGSEATYEGAAELAELLRRAATLRGGPSFWGSSTSPLIMSTLRRRMFSSCSTAHC